MNNIETTQIAYDNFANEYFSQNVKNWPGKEYIKDFLKSLDGEKRILDLGCGNGFLAEYAMSKGFEVKGYDLSKNMIAAGLKWNKKLDLRFGDMVDIPKESRLYDGAVYIYSFMHLNKAQAKKSLLSLNANLKVDAKILIITCKGRGQCYIPCGVNKDKVFFKSYSFAEIKSLLEECGFVIDDLKVQQNKQTTISAEDFVIYGHKQNDVEVDDWYVDAFKNSKQ